MLPLGGTLPFHAGDGADTGAEPDQEFVALDPCDCDDDTVDEIIPFDMLDKYDSLLPEAAADFNIADFGDQLVIEYDFLFAVVGAILASPGVFPPHAGIGDKEALSEACILLLTAFGRDDVDAAPTDIFDKYEVAVLLPAVVTVFIADFGDQLVIEYDLAGCVASILALFPSESVLLDELNEYDVDWAVPVLAADTLDKYDALLLPVVASFTSDFGDHFDKEYDLLGGVLITAFGDATSDVVIEFC